jgi:DNA-binding beta-propeller fold protein YncE
MTHLIKNYKPVSVLVFTLFLLFLIPTKGIAQDYYIYVAAESEDEVHLIHFNGESNKAEIAKTIKVGRYPTETDGPHGINISLDGKHWFLSIAHGNPYGMLAKYETGTDKLVATTDLGMFPASMEISKSTGLLYVVNFNLHGDMVPSTVSVVDPDFMEVITNIETGIMPHGSRISEDGTKQYHVSMMTDELIEINTAGLNINRRLDLKKEPMNMKGMEKKEDNSEHDMGNMEHGEKHEEHMKDGTHEKHMKEKEM